MTQPWSVLQPTQRVFDALVARLRANTAFPDPEREYLAVGDIDFSTRCSQFAVSARQMYLGVPNIPNPGSIGAHAGFRPYSLELGVAYTDCWPIVEDVLNADKETAAATDLLARVDIVISELFAAYYAGELVDDCTNGVISPAVLVGPEGGVAGVTVQLAVQLN